MDPIKFAGCIAALVVLVAFIAPVSADTFTGFGQAGSKYSGNQVYLASALGSAMTGDSGSPNMGYSFAARGSGARPTYGDVSSYFNYFGRSGSNQSARQSVRYSESSRASGIIYQYSQTISVTL